MRRLGTVLADVIPGLISHAKLERRLIVTVFGSALQGDEEPAATDEADAALTCSKEWRMPACNARKVAMTASTPSAAADLLRARGFNRGGFRAVIRPLNSEKAVIVEWPAV